MSPATPSISSGPPRACPDIALRETTTTKLVFRPEIINNPNDNRASVKGTFLYQRKGPAGTWPDCESIPLSSLKKGEGYRLRLHSAELLHLITELNTLYRDFEGTDPSSVASAVVHALKDPQVAAHMARMELNEGLIGALRANIRLSEMRNAVRELRGNLEADKNSESVYQDWCERHSWAFGNAYVMRDQVRELTPGDTLDMLLPTVISGYRDIVELKRPDMTVLLYDESRRNHYFSAHVSKAIGQCHRYLDVLHEEAGKGLRDHQEIVAYHPRAIIVIGRSSDWGIDQVRALHGLNQRLSGVNIMTYDHLLAQGERVVEMIDDNEFENGDGIPW